LIALQNVTDGQAFVFDKRPIPNRLGIEEDESLYSKSLPHENEFLSRIQRPRANTLSEPESQKIELEKEALPTVFKWDGGGKQVYISGTFSDWKALPMVKSHGDFVTVTSLLASFFLNDHSHRLSRFR
jgi:5'-AMP-activated protein kinase, regulatory beta subunit